ncbi:ADP-ribose diphosphatase [Alteromonas sp. ASW11-36]|uniref:ADP-ribose pyrophosphatase n=1 Tax=Alteromonas arenosi TaxID=3055817 RepID=A0ABT7SZT3_9ALTE|nr:ADP-ribose diphosphatase [Alteromonas sp. ASW11-36]MDM7861697.1 ADP-ribose diphosphatase [Alteromonas sp. ASW11-36]
MPKIQRYSSADVRQLTTRPLYDGYFKMVQYRFQHRLFDGGWSGDVVREIFERGHAVAVLPYDPVTDEFVLIEQFRIGAMETSDSPWLIEVIAGIIDEGEEPAEVCHREAMEEAGITLSNLTEAVSYLASPGGTTERLQIYMAQVDASEAHGVHGLDNESEDILVHRVPVNEAEEWLKNGKIDNAAAIIAVQWFLLNKANLLAQWQGDNAE